MNIELGLQTLNIGMHSKSFYRSLQISIGLLTDFISLCKQAFCRPLIISQILLEILNPAINLARDLKSCYKSC